MKKDIYAGLMSVQGILRSEILRTKADFDKTRNFHGIHGITENSDKYGNVRGIVNKTRNFDN